MNILGAGIKTLWNGWGPRTVNAGMATTVISPQMNNDNTYKLIGRLSYQDINSHTNHPMPNALQRMELHVPGLCGSKCIAEAITNSEGEFEFTYPKLKGKSPHQVLIKLVDEAYPFSAQKLNGTNAQIDKVTRIYQLQIPHHALEAKVDLLSEDSAQPFSLTKVPPPSPAQWQSNRYLYQIFKASLPFLAPATFVSLFGRWMTGAQVQKLYDKMSPNYQKFDLTPESLIDCLINGIGNVGFTKQGDQVMWEANWDQFKFKEGREDSLPNVQVFATIVNEQCLLERISLKFREDATEEVFEVNDPKINRAIYLALTAFGLKGEVEHHLAETHLLTRVTSVFFDKYISRENPLFNELRHFCGEIEWIDYLGANQFNGLVFGENGILSGSPIEDSVPAGERLKGLEQFLEETIHAKADWKRPFTTPLCEQDEFNHDAIVHYQNLLEYYNDFVTNYRAGISEHWREIYYLSEALRQQLPKCPPITLREQDPQKEDLDNLAQFIARHVATVSRIHDWVHKSQDRLKNIGHMSIGVRNRALDANGNFATDGNTTALDAKVQLVVIGTLLKYNNYADTIAENAMGDIPPSLINKLQQSEHLYKRPNGIRTTMATVKI